MFLIRILPIISLILYWFLEPVNSNRYGPQGYGFSTTSGRISPSSRAAKLPVRLANDDSPWIPVHGHRFVGNTKTPKVPAAVAKVAHSGPSPKTSKHSFTQSHLPEATSTESPNEKKNTKKKPKQQERRHKKTFSRSKAKSRRRQDTKPTEAKEEEKKVKSETKPEKEMESELKKEPNTTMTTEATDTENGMEEMKKEEEKKPEEDAKKEEEEEEEKNSDESGECDGFDNFLEDLGLVTYILDIGICIVGIISLVLGIIIQVYTYFSVYVVALPASLFWILGEENVPAWVQDISDWMSLFDTLFNIFILVPLGDQLNVAGVISELLTMSNFIVSTVGTFPDIAEEFMELFLGVDPDDVFEGYGCSERAPFNEVSEQVVKLLLAEFDYPYDKQVIGSNVNVSSIIT